MASKLPLIDHFPCQIYENVVTLSWIIR